MQTLNLDDQTQTKPKRPRATSPKRGQSPHRRLRNPISTRTAIKIGIFAVVGTLIGLLITILSTPPVYSYKSIPEPFPQTQVIIKTPKAVRRLANWTAEHTAVFSLNHKRLSTAADASALAAPILANFDAAYKQWEKVDYKASGSMISPTIAYKVMKNLYFAINTLSHPNNLAYAKGLCDVGTPCTRHIPFNGQFWYAYVLGDVSGLNSTIGTLYDGALFSLPASSHSG